MNLDTYFMIKQAIRNRTRANTAASPGRVMQKRAEELPPPQINPVGETMRNTGHFLTTDLPGSISNFRKKFWKHMPDSLKDMTYRGLEDYGDLAPPIYPDEEDWWRDTSRLLSPNPLEKAHAGLNILSNLGHEVGTPLYYTGSRHRFR